MKLKNRVLSIIMVLAMLISSVAVYADDIAEDEAVGTQLPASTEKLYGKLLLLESLGYFDDMSELELDGVVTRAQFAQWLEITANLVGETPYKTTEFTDVNVKDDAYAAIQNVVSAGYMSGMGGSVFMPSAVISLSDAAVSLVRLTGKDAYALVKGGYPTGYEVTARSIGLYDGVKTGSNTTINVLTMIYNALTADYLASDGLSSNGIMYVTGQTVLNFFHNIYEVEGIMTANGFTKTYSDDIIADSDSVEIDKVVYKCGNDDLNDLIGMYVTGFYHFDEETEERTLVSAYADDNDNTVMTLPSKDLRLVGLTLYYPIDNGAREKKVELTAGFDFIYNNRAVPTRADADILIADGELTLIDKNNDKKYDTVIARDAVTEKITGIDTYKSVIYTENLAIQKADYDGAVMIIKHQDKKTDVISSVLIDELSVGSVVTVYSSKDGMYNEVIATEKSIIGTPTAITEDDTVVIEDVEYELARIAAKADLVTGMSSEIFLDYMGRIAFVTKSANLDYSYGYVFKVYFDNEVEEEVLNLMTAYGEKKYVVNDRLMIDGVGGASPATLETLLSNGSVIRYRLDSKETVRSVDTEATGSLDERHDKLTKIVNQQNLRYNSDGIAIGDNAEYVMGRNTFKLQLPTDTAEKADKNNIKPYFMTGMLTQNYSFTIYDWDPDTLEVGMVIYHSSEKMKTPNVDNYSDAAVVKRVYRVWEDGEDIIKIVLLNDSGEMEYVANENLTEAQMRQMEFGDVIRYELDADGKFAAFNIDYDVHATSPARNTLGATTSGDWRYDAGKIAKRYNDYLVIDRSAGGKGTINIKSVTCTVLVDMSEHKIDTIEKKYYASSAGSASSPSYVFVRQYRNARADILVMYKY